MILPSSVFLNLVCWIADKFGLELGLSNDSIVDPLDEREISEQLRYGRD